MIADVSSLEDRLFGLCPRITASQSEGPGRMLPSSLSGLPALEILMLIGFAVLAIPF
jgi:hypothetical protein